MRKLRELNTKNVDIVPGDPAVVLDQGFSSTCVAHAVGNAIAEQLHYSDCVNIANCAALVVNKLVNFIGNIDAVWPDCLNNCDPWWMEQKSGHWGRVTNIHVIEENIVDYNSSEKYVLAYHPTGPHTRHSYHCMFIEKLLHEKNAFRCINSWGRQEPNPEIEKDRKGNRIWKVRCEWEDAENTKGELSHTG